MWNSNTTRAAAALLALVLAGLVTWLIALGNRSERDERIVASVGSPSAPIALPTARAASGTRALACPNGEWEYGLASIGLERMLTAGDLRIIEQHGVQKCTIDQSVGPHTISCAPSTPDGLKLRLKSSALTVEAVMTGRASASFVQAAPGLWSIVRSDLNQLQITVTMTLGNRSIPIPLREGFARMFEVQSKLLYTCAGDTLQVRSTLPGAAAPTFLMKRAGAKQATPEQDCSASEDWDFSRADFEALRRRGDRITIADDSNWLPKSLRMNLLATLESLYSQPTSRLTGVSERDLYHGHIVVPRGALPAQVLELNQRYGLLAARVRELNSQPASDERTAALRAALRDLQQAAVELTAALVEVDPRGRVSTTGPATAGGGVIYHSHETIAGAMGIPAGSPERNFFTPFSSMTPGPFRPTSIDDHDFADRYEELMSFSFLIDCHGRLHAYPTEGIDELREELGTPTQPLDPFESTIGGPESMGDVLVWLDDPERPTSWVRRYEDAHPYNNQIIRAPDIGPHIYAGGRRWLLRDDGRVEAAPRSAESPTP